MLHQYLFQSHWMKRNDTMDEELSRRLKDLKTSDKLKIINDYYSEIDLEFDDEKENRATFRCNPFEGQVWRVLDALEYIDGIYHIEVVLITDYDEKYMEDDLIKIKYEY